MATPAIAMAVLDTLIERGCTVIVTTHHNVLKNYGYTHEEAVNASGRQSARPEWPLFVAALPGKPTRLTATGGGGVFALALEVTS